MQTIATGEGNRTYRLHVPPSYTGAAAVPLVLNMHGATSSASSQELYSAFSPKADAEGFIVAYPQGVTTGASPFTHFNAWQNPSPEPDDVAFLSTLLDALEVQLCIDHSRVFSTGLSNGGMMSVRLACSLSWRIAAIAPVAGSYYPPMALDLNPAETCPDTRPFPILVFHGTSDAIVPYAGGYGGLSGFMVTFRLPIDDATPAEDVLADWSAHNGCSPPRVESQVDTEIRLIEYGSCANGAAVQHYAIDGGGHTWPGAANVPSLGYTTHQISATNLSWDFFLAHPLTPCADSDSDELTDCEEAVFGTDPGDGDTDGDGCSDGSEYIVNNPDHVLGGDRDPLSPWDFADVPVPSLPAPSAARNAVIGISDVIAALPWIGTFDDGPANGYGNDYDSDTNGNLVEDGIEYDRSPSATPGKPWRLTAPSGAVGIADAIALLASVGDHC